MSTEKQAVFQALRVLIVELDKDRITQGYTTQSLKKLINEHASSRQRHQEKIEAVVGSSLKTAVDSSMVDLKSGLSDAGAQARAAASTYQHHAKSSIWKIFGFQMTLFGLFMLMVFLAFSVYFPNVEDIKNLQAEEARLINNIKTLNDYGLTNCKIEGDNYSRPCIDIEPTSRAFGTGDMNLRVIRGSKKTYDN